jgi:catechol 2,3-dioxygenase-like lactoylglutathione lyase family enzyme
MFDHVTIRASDREASERFYALVLGTIGVGPAHSDDYYAQWADFSLAAANGEQPATRGLHIAFAAHSRGHVDEFWRAGTAAGHHDDGAPGPRPQYSASYYGAFLLDPDGNSAEAVHHDNVRSDGGYVDHLWIRVAGVAASKRFYELVASYADFRLKTDNPDRVRFAADRGSFSLVAGPGTRNVHVAFPVADDATVDAFHRAAVDAGYGDNGPPGERPLYHPGYYGAFVLDPDGNNVELVNHNRST